ncbi:unnamed protein product [Anisakis simplex]|uniref:RIIa domain-containing protein n=1 Tax=Anisakis simplex TaxID=6269 RepID=A0A0M3JQT5_ANISI|nr:unnamed protein product [Anisakis simplex]
MAAQASSADKYKVPAGLRPLLEALARETLRAQPTDLISFSQLFFQELQRHRDECGKEVDILKEPALYEKFKNDLQMKYQQQQQTTGTDNSPQEQPPRSQSPMDLAATKIQAAFRGHIVRANPEKFGLDKPEVVMQRRRSHEHIQVADTRKDLNEGAETERSELAKSSDDSDVPKTLDCSSKKEIEDLKRDDDAAETANLNNPSTTDAADKMTTIQNRDNETDNSQHADVLGRHSVGGYTLERDTPEDRAATKIQAEIRGFLARKHVQSMRKEGDEAATKIQAHIRGFLTRKHLEETGVMSPSHSHSSIKSSRSDDIDKDA